MRYEKIFKRENGSRVKIDVSLYVDWSDKKPDYDFSVYTCGANKRTWINPHSIDDYMWRKLGTVERKKYEIEKYRPFITESEINEAMVEAWNTLTPKPFKYQEVSHV